MNLKFKFEKLKVEEPENQGSTSHVENDIEKHTFVSTVRNLHLTDVSGKQTFHNYAYLVSGEFVPDENSITLIFTSATITLKGRKLETLFGAFMNHAPKSITGVDKRYERTKSEQEVFVTEINIAKI